MLDIRPVAPEDAGAVLEILSDPEVASWLRGAGEAGPFTHAECEAIVAQKVAHWIAHGFGMSLAFRGERCVGRSVVQHSKVAGRSEVEIGWAVARDMWGQGLATKLGRHALTTATKAGFERVVAFTRPDNVASRRVMEKLGLGYEREFEHAGLAHVLYTNA
jgi:ribosomal-protein-alanine N-acetyltransferase